MKVTVKIPTDNLNLPTGPNTLPIGSMFKSPDLKGREDDIILKTRDGYVSLNHPASTWKSLRPAIRYQLLPVGTQIIIEVQPPENA